MPPPLSLQAQLEDLARLEGALAAAKERCPSR
jgi:hypothetical protein